MDWLNHEIARLPRRCGFPFQVNLLFFCQNQYYLPRLECRRTPEDAFEINIRLRANHEICCDIINGVEIRERFPHAVWKMPGGEHWLQQGTVRDTIAFGYPAAALERFRELGMVPKGYSKSFSFTPEIRYHLDKFKELCLQLYSPGVADRIDWLCFQLYREMCFANACVSESRSGMEQIKNISLYLQMHLGEEIDLDEVADAHGLSRAVFYRKWKELFSVSPLQYILNLKLEAAGRMLRQTDLPISEICREIHYSGTTAFHRRFRAKFGMTPDEFRRAERAKEHQVI